MMSGNDSVCGPGYADVGQLGLQQGRPREGGKAPERGQLPGQAEYGAGHDGQRPGGGRGSVGGEDSGKTGSGGSQDRGGYSCRDRDEERYGSVTGDKNVREISFQRKKSIFFFVICYLK